MSVTTREARELAGLILDLQRQVQALQRSPQLAYSAIDEGTLDFKDGDGLVRVTIGQQPDGTYTAVEQNGPPPPRPTDPIVAGFPGGLTVRWDGGFNDTVLAVDTDGDGTLDAPADFDHIEVHVGTEPGYIPTDFTQIGTMRSTKGETLTLALDTDEFFVCLVAVSRSGTESAPSAQVAGYPEAIVPTTDGIPPASSPAPTVIGGVGALYARWAGVANQSDVTYDVHLSASDGFTPDATTLVASTTATTISMRTLPDGTPLTTDTTYYVRVIARDTDGSASASAQGSDQLYKVGNAEISATYGYFGTVTFDQITGGSMNANAVLAGTFATSESGQRVVFSNDGITAWGANNKIMFDLPARANANGSTRPATFKGEAEFDSVTVNDALAVRGSKNEISAGSRVTLASGATAPVQPPAAAIAYNSTPIANADFVLTGYTVVGWVRNPASGYDYVCTISPAGNLTYVYAINRSTGAVVQQYSMFRYKAAGIIGKPNGDGFALVGHYTDGTGTPTQAQLRWYRVNPATNVDPVLVSTTVPPLGTMPNTLVAGRTFAAGTYTVAGARAILVATMNASASTITLAVWAFPSSDGGAFVTVDSLKRTVSTTGITNTDPAKNVLGSPHAGTFDGRGAANQGGGNDYYAIPIGSDVHVWGTDSTPAYQPALKWRQSASGHPGGFQAHSTVAVAGGGSDWAYDGFKEASPGGSVGVVYSDGTYVPNGSTEVWWVAHGWFNTSSGYTTRIGPKKAITPVSRAALVLTVPAIPKGNPNDPSYVANNNPNAVRFFIGKGTSSTTPADSGMWLQDDPDPTDTTLSLVSLRTSGTAAPSVGTFPQSAGAMIVSTATRADGQPMTQIGGDGAARVDGLLLPGLILPYGGPVPGGGADFKGWFLCDGTEVSRTIYGDLFALIGEAFGKGNSSTTFNLPDLRGRMPIGAHSLLAVGSKGGAAQVYLSVAQLPAHTHNIQQGGAHGHIIPITYATNTPTTGAASRLTDFNNRLGASGTSASTTLDAGGSHSHTADNTGQGAALDVTNPYTAVNWLIKW